MIKTRTLLLKLAHRFPKTIAKKYHDHVGLMVGKLPLNTQKIVLALDFDETIIEEVLALEPDLIITHHPFIYGSRARVLKNDPSRAEMVARLEEAGACLYSYHTNFDEGVGGMNDALAHKLGLTHITPLNNDPMARGGQLVKPLPIAQFAAMAAEKLGVSYGLLLAEGNQKISSVAIVGGGGARSWSIARDEGYDIFISGDAPHHVRRGIVVNQYNYLDLPHEIERIFLPTMKARLLEIDPQLEIVIINHEKTPIPVLVNTL